MITGHRDEEAIVSAVGVIPNGLMVRIKYTLDRFLSLLLVMLLAPLFAVIWLGVWLEDGRPVLFRQTRPGLGGRPFQCYKFRTMIVDADNYVDDQGRPTRSRITRFGGVLRRTSLDELPQLFNIIKGEMSFVGPRPPVMDHLQRYTDSQMKRFRMKPGVTGLAQINGRNTIPWSKRLEFDNLYIDHYSWSSDPVILFKTVGMVIKRDGIVIDRNPDQVDDLAPVNELDAE